LILFKQTLKEPPHALRALPRPASPSPPWICGRAQRASAPCPWAQSSVPSRTCAPSAPRCCAHGRERQGRSVERATRPTPPSFTAPPWRTPPRRGLRGFQATTGSRMSSHKGMPVCAAVGGPSVQPRSHGHGAAGLPPPCAGLPGDVLAPHRLGNALAQTRRLASPHRPPRGTAGNTVAAALCPCHDCLSPPVPLVRGLRPSRRFWRSAAVPLLPAPEGSADGVCLSTGFAPSLHGFAMSCPRAPASGGVSVACG
jgi:hypothetical protein